jgi:hypothetical protein
MSADHDGGINDLLLGLERPLWEGSDEEFAAYCRQQYGIPASIALITVTPRSASGRSAVAIGGAEGAIVFVVTPNPHTRKTQITRVVMGPLIADRDVVARAHASDGIADLAALTRVALRHLPVEVVTDMFMEQ